MTDGLTVDNLTIEIGGRTLLSDLSFSVSPGEVVTLMGPSGSGKSTILSYLCGTLDRAFIASGRVTLNGSELTGSKPEERQLGILFQEALLFPHLSIGENLAFGLPRRISGEARHTRVAEALTDAGLEGFENRDPETLSGGQKARVAMMRTLLAEPGALLLDEPFSKLDANLRHKFRLFVFEHAVKAGLPTVLVTHDIADADAAAGPVIRLAADA